MSTVIFLFIVNFTMFMSRKNWTGLETQTVKVCMYVNEQIDMVLFNGVKDILKLSEKCVQKYFCLNYNI